MGWTGATGEVLWPWKELLFWSNGSGKPPWEDHTGCYVETRCRALQRTGDSGKLEGFCNDVRQRGQ